MIAVVLLVIAPIPLLALDVPFLATESTRSVPVPALLPELQSSSHVTPNARPLTRPFTLGPVLPSDPNTNASIGAPVGTAIPFLQAVYRLLRWQRLAPAVRAMTLAFA